MPRRGCLLSTNILPHTLTHTDINHNFNSHTHTHTCESEGACLMPFIRHFPHTHTQQRKHWSIHWKHRILRTDSRASCVRTQANESIERFSIDCVGVVNVCCGCLHQHWTRPKHRKRLWGLAIRQHDITFPTNSALIRWQAMTTHRTMHWGKHSRFIVLQLTDSHLWPSMFVCSARSSCANSKSKRVYRHAEGGRMFVDVLGIESFTHFTVRHNQPSVVLASHVHMWNGDNKKKNTLNYFLYTNESFFHSIGVRGLLIVVVCVYCEWNECHVWGFDCSTLWHCECIGFHTNLYTKVYLWRLLNYIQQPPVFFFFFCLNHNVIDEILRFHVLD